MKPTHSFKEIAILIILALLVFILASVVLST